MKRKRFLELYQKKKVYTIVYKEKFSRKKFFRTLIVKRKRFFRTLSKEKFSRKKVFLELYQKKSLVEKKFF